MTIHVQPSLSAQGVPGPRPFPQSLVGSSQQACEVDAVFIPILQLSTLRLKEAVI